MFLLFIDLVFRFFKKEIGFRGFSHAYRFIMFLFLLPIISITDSTGFRGFAGDFIKGGLFDAMHNSYFGVGFIGIFSVDGLENKDLYMNAVFFEALIYLILILASLASALFLLTGNPIAHFINNLRMYFALSFMFLFTTRFGLVWFAERNFTGDENFQ